MKSLSARANRTLRLAIAALALGAAAAPAGGVPIVNVSTSATASVLGNTPDGETSAVSGAALAATAAEAVLSAPITSTSNFLVSGAAAGMARPGILAASAVADLQSTHTGTLSFLADNLAGGLAFATVDFFIDDLVVTATGGGGAAMVPVALRLDLSGGLSASGSMNSPGFEWPAGAGGSASLSVEVEASAIGTATFAGTRSYSNNNRNEVAAGGTGILAGGDQLVTPVFHVTLGTPFSLRVSMDVSAGASTNVTHGNADAAATFAHTLRFPTGGPVFDLPEGYTLDAPSAGIVDNAFAVPEPSTLSLTLFGSALLASLRRAPARSRRAARRRCV
jgi:hypothetical protein